MLLKFNVWVYSLVVGFGFYEFKGFVFMLRSTFVHALCFSLLLLVRV